MAPLSYSQKAFLSSAFRAIVRKISAHYIGDTRRFSVVLPVCQNLDALQSLLRHQEQELAFVTAFGLLYKTIKTNKIIYKMFNECNLDALDLSNTEVMFLIRKGFHAERISCYRLLSFIADEIVMADAREVESGRALPVDRIVRNIDSLRSINPGQKLSPVNFDIANNLLVIAHQEHQAAAIDRSNVEAARLTLAQRGQQILQTLERSNCDRRAVEQFDRMGQVMESGDDIIRLGIEVLSSEIIVGTIQDELSPVLVGIVSAHFIGLRLYLSQFPEWKQFVGHSAEIVYSDEQRETLLVAADSTIEQLRSKEGIADPEVPRVIEAMRAALSSPGKSSSRAFFALFRTLENMLSKLISFSTDIISETAKKTIDRSSTALSKVIAGGIIVLALTVASKILPITSAVPDSNWIINANRVIQEIVKDITAP